MLWLLGIFYRHLGYFITLWYILCSSGTFFPVLVSCTKKNLATLVVVHPAAKKRGTDSLIPPPQKKKFQNDSAHFGSIQYVSKSSKKIKGIHHSDGRIPVS
jgi:hypothetical protein